MPLSRRSKPRRAKQINEISARLLSSSAHAYPSSGCNGDAGEVGERPGERLVFAAGLINKTLSVNHVRGCPERGRDAGAGCCATHPPRTTTAVSKQTRIMITEVGKASNSVKRAVVLFDTMHHIG